MRASIASSFLPSAAWLLALAAASTVACGGDEAPADGGTGGAPASGGTGGAAPTGRVCSVELTNHTSYAYDSNVPWSQSPPGGLDVAEVPLLISIGWDDNPVSGLDPEGPQGGLAWALELASSRSHADGAPLHFSFYANTHFVVDKESDEPERVKQGFQALVAAGHEVGNHTHSHPHTNEEPPFSAEQYAEEIDTCTDWLTKPWSEPADFAVARADSGGGVPAEAIVGFRSPFLEYNDSFFDVLRERGFWYDCSIEEGWQGSVTARTMPWPFTLDSGSPGNDLLVSWQTEDWHPRSELTPHPGMWELPPSPIVVPPDAVMPGLRASLAERVSYFDASDAKITGLDYNMWTEFSMTKDEFLATLKYTLDERLAGNRAPMLFGAHSQYYSTAWNEAPAATLEERQAAIEEFLDYALTFPEVRIVSMKEVVDYMRDPAPLTCTGE